MRHLSGSNYKLLSSQPGRRDEIVFDAEVPGLALRVYASGAGKWIVQYRPKHSLGARSKMAPKRIVIGDRRFMSLSAAREAAINILARVNAGADPVAEKAARRRRPRNTVGAAMSMFLIDMERRQIVNRTTVASTLNRAFHGQLARELGALGLADLIEIMTQIEKRSGPGAAQDFRSRSSSFLSFAAAHGLVERNPWLGFRRPRPSRAERMENVSHGRVLAEPEIAAIWNVACRRHDSFGRIVQFLILSGARRGEAAGLRWDWVRESTINLPASFTKQARGHLIPRSNGINALLSKTPSRGPLLWPTERRIGGSTPISGWSRLLSTLVSDAKCGYFTFHDFRRTFRTWAEKEGVPDAVAEAAIGHVDRETLKRVYARPNWESELADLFERWSEKIMLIAKTAITPMREVA